MSKVHIIHENGVWVEPLREQLDALGVTYEEWNLVEGSVPIDEVPPEGIFYNRMSASSYTRDHRFAPEYATVVLLWLEAHGRRIINDSRALAIEINKAAQHNCLIVRVLRRLRQLLLLALRPSLTQLLLIMGVNLL